MPANEDTEEVTTMAATIDIEVECGTYTQPFRQHRGYYAGDFSAPTSPGEQD